MTDFSYEINQINISSPNLFLDQVKQKKIQSLTEYFLFSTPTLINNFFMSLNYLVDNDTWTQEDLLCYTFIAQTIDNDYIFANENETLIIPYSFSKRDSELYSLPINIFFKQYLLGVIKSKTLSNP